MPDCLRPETASSYAHCAKMAQRCAGNFYLGMRLTPEPKRSAVFAIYAWMRQADDLADGFSAAPTFAGPAPTRCQALEQFAEETELTLAADEVLPEGPLWPAVRDAAERFALAPEHFHTMLDAQRQDLQPRSIQTFDDLYAYCYSVASVVGLLCVQIWGNDRDPAVAQLAEYRGIALQLTNILRDLAEDARRQRVYLPAEDLERFGYSAAELAHGQVNPAFARLMRFQIERARSYYDMSATLERHLSPDCRATSYALMQTYRVLLRRIAAEPPAVLRRRVRLSRLSKLRIVLGALHRRRKWASQEIH